MSLADDFDNITSLGPVRRKKPVVTDTTDMKSKIDADKSARLDAIALRDKNRADSSANETVSRLMGREGDAYGDLPNEDHISAVKQGTTARIQEAKIAAIAKAIGARTDSLAKMRQGGKP